MGGDHLVKTTKVLEGFFIFKINCSIFYLLLPDFLGSFLGLDLNKIKERTLIGNESGVVTFLNNLSVVQHEDHVTTLDGGKSVGDLDSGESSFRDNVLVNRPLDVLLSNHVQGRSGFIEDKDLGLLDEGPCNSDSLTLSTREFYPLLSYKLLIAFREFEGVHDEFVGVGLFSSLDDLFSCSFFNSIGNVVVNGSFIQFWFLRNDSNSFLMEPRKRDILEVSSVDRNLSLERIVESHQ